MGGPLQCHDGCAAAQAMMRLMIASMLARHERLAHAAGYETLMCSVAEIGSGVAWIVVPN